MTDFKITKGYDVPIKGVAAKEISELPKPSVVGLCPNEFYGMKPKLAVKEGDTVKVGTPLFFNKKQPEVLFVSPASGTVSKVKYGPRRVIEEVVVDANGKDEYESFEIYDLAKIEMASRDAMVDHLCKTGLWPLIRRRPFTKIANVAETPKSIFVNCMDTAPLACDPNFAYEGKEAAFEVGIAALKRLSDKVHVVTSQGPSSTFTKPKGVTYHTFTGKHPTGLVGTHIGKIDPINKGDVVWFLNAQDVIVMGSTLMSGKYETSRVVAVAGPGASKPQYYRTHLGVKVKDLLKGGVVSGELRFISGNVLYGTQKAEDTFHGYYDNLLTVIPEGREQYMLGWALPSFNKQSFTRVLPTGFMSGKTFDMTTNLNGGRRAIIVSGEWDKVVALDVEPEFLIKATMANDLDAMEQLGLLEVDPEDFALCTYICPSKTEISQVIADGLELMEKEG
jgi:Na+-transporting NADH:ubiquinone oxidoreductase subunit A